MRKKTIVSQITEEIQSHRYRIEALMNHVGGSNLALDVLNNVLEFIDESNLVDEEVENIKGAYKQGKEDENPDLIVQYIDETDYFNNEYKH